MGLLNRINNSQKVQEDRENNQIEKKDIFNDSIIEKHQSTVVSRERELKRQVQRKIMEQFGNVQDIDKVVSQIEPITLEIIKKDQENFRRVNTKKIVQEIINDITGYGPINPLLQDPEITEVMVNGPDMVYVEKEGKLQFTDIKFRDDDQVMQVIEKIVSPLGRRIDESSPMVDARLPDGSRVNAIIPPLSLNGPVITIRKFSKYPYTIEDLINFGTLSKEMAVFLNACVKAKINIFICGGTSSGKTTTLNVLSSFIPNNERIITIEDAAELQLSQEHVISLESRPPNIEGKGEVTIRDLVINSLRMRPDRLVVGEVRGGEALDMLQAMNTGQDGSLATGHSNTSRDMISRLETMVLMAGVDLPVRAIRQQIAGAISLIVEQTRFKDGTRKIVNITEVRGMEGDAIVLQDIFKFKQKKIDVNGKVVGDFVPTGVRPKFYDDFQAYGIQVPASIFNPEGW
ncbi:CpaF family protein [Clostridium sp. JN-9]|uniref:CpaF family protein n=1 Tax=Clostridium sp. JN-9 TaxID=2507159 RepID=UPI000FFE0B8E|nr:CpaF family protein [Clostridium sp. JN-9]QAT41590.1 CpaF family protein [Clostridium sp. JN-9]